MTDEELFKAWKSEQYKDQSTEEKMEFVEHLHTFPQYFEKTFLAGLKAGRPQWHDLRKDPKDLPKKELWNKQLLLLVDRNGLPPCFVVGYYEESEVLEDYEKNWGWYNIAENVAYDFIDYDVIAWCELPTFDKE